MLTLIIGEYEDAGLGSASQLVRSLVWSVIWFCYLSFSTQVQEVIPIEYRKRTKLDYGIIAIMVIVPLFTFSYAFFKAYITQTDMGEFIEVSSLKNGEHTDGKIAFLLPKGFECDSSYYEDLKLFQLSYSDVASIILVSDIDGDQSESNIKDCQK